MAGLTNTVHACPPDDIGSCTVFTVAMLPPRLLFLATSLLATQVKVRHQFFVESRHIPTLEYYQAGHLGPTAEAGKVGDPILLPGFLLVQLMDLAGVADDIAYQITRILLFLFCF